ncbi:MAG: MBL fold metallo-hydrolase RNA specificity domain-containing protein, partial [Myxococcota bacterium]
LHVSGHAHREEQKRMIELLRPRSFMPIHGTLHHLARHAAFARELGVKDVLLAEDGDVVELREQGLRRMGVTEVGKLATFSGDEIPEEVLKQRESLGRYGAAFVTVRVDRRGQLIAPPVVATRGVLHDEEERELLDGTVQDVAKTLSGWSFSSEYPTDQQIIEVAERAVRRSLDGISGRRPVAIVHVVRS